MSFHISPTETTCHLFAPHWRRCPMARKVGQIVRRGSSTWLVRVYCGRDVETKKRQYLNQTIHGGLRDAQAHLNKMLSERDRGRKLDSSKQTLNQYLDRWLELCAKPRLRAKSLKDYEGLLRRYVRPGLGTKALPFISAFDMTTWINDWKESYWTPAPVSRSRTVISGKSSMSYAINTPSAGTGSAVTTAIQTT